MTEEQRDQRDRRGFNAVFAGVDQSGEQWIEEEADLDSIDSRDRRVASREVADGGYLGL